MSNRSAQRELDTVLGRVNEAPDRDVALHARGLVSMIRRSEKSVMLSASWRRGGLDGTVSMITRSSIL